MRYEFLVFDEKGLERTQYVEAPTDGAAIRKAGAIVKREGGSVDIARRRFLKPWDERYMTTIMPSEFHAAGFRQERLT